MCRARAAGPDAPRRHLLCRPPDPIAGPAPALRLCLAGRPGPGCLRRWWRQPRPKRHPQPAAVGRDTQPVAHAGPGADAESIAIAQPFPGAKPFAQSQPRALTDADTVSLSSPAAATIAAHISGVVAAGLALNAGALVRVLDATGKTIADKKAVTTATGAYGPITLTGTGPFRVEACGSVGDLPICVWRRHQQRAA